MCSMAGPTYLADKRWSIKGHKRGAECRQMDARQDLDLATQPDLAHAVGFAIANCQNVAYAEAVS
jgi:hypothetical protein